jgi:membrane-associated phospholipid phosphatase
MVTQTSRQAQTCNLTRGPRRMGTVALALKTELKLLFGRVPPHAWFWHQSAPLRNFHLMYSGSFPSGHMVIMGVLTPFVWAYAPPTLKLSWCVACTAVGAALMALNAHFFSDLVAGILLGITVGVASRSIDKKGGRMVPKQS